jgi:hypothetical protein
MTFRQFLWVAIAGLTTGTSPPAAAPLRLNLPVMCSMQTHCLVQKLVDVDATPARVDYRCGSLTTDGHDGIDIRVRTMADMRRGVAVVAAAPGRVLRVRDGEPDMNIHDRGNLDGLDAGNGVVIDHGNGWETQYSHLRNRSVAVRPGMAVGAGEGIGSIGISGNAEFPHLHFTVRHNGHAVDPFTGREPPSSCGVDNGGRSLWSKAAEQALPYRPTAIIAVGFSSVQPSGSVAERESSKVGTTTPIILWGDALGAKPGDRQQFEILAPDGAVVLERASLIEKGGLSWFAYAGHKPPAGGWQRGTYKGRYELKRSGTIVDAREERLTIE